jgi:hypothetical protein
MQNLALLVFPDLKDDGIQPVTHPPDGEKLLWNVGPSIKPIRLREQLARLLKSDPAPGIRPETLAFPRIKAEAHLI